jgi:hypothetical protein
MEKAAFYLVLCGSILAAFPLMILFIRVIFINKAESFIARQLAENHSKDDLYYILDYLHKGYTIQNHGHDRIYNLVKQEIESHARIIGDLAFNYRDYFNMCFTRPFMFRDIFGIILMLFRPLATFTFRHIVYSLNQPSKKGELSYILKIMKKSLQYPSPNTKEAEIIARV